MTEPKRWTVPGMEPQYMGDDEHGEPRYYNPAPPIEVVAAADFDRLRDERDRLRQEAGVMGSSHNPPENPYFEGEGHNDLHGAWAEGYAAGKVASDDAWISGDMVRLSMQDSYSEGLAAGRAAATPDPDATAVLAAVKAIIDEPLDERDGHGPTRTGQFARIDALLRDRPTTAWDEGYAEGFAAGRAAATPPDTDLLAELVKLVEIHHNTVRPSKLHDPVSIHDWRDCPCLTCRRVASVEAVVKAEGRTPAASPDERLREALAWIAEYGERNGDLRTGHLQAVKHIARNALGLEPDLPLAAADREAPDEAGRICCRGMGADGGCNICAAEATR